MPAVDDQIAKLEREKKTRAKEITDAQARISVIDTMLAALKPQATPKPAAAPAKDGNK